MIQPRGRIRREAGAATFISTNDTQPTIMKTTRKQNLVAAALVCALAFATTISRAADPLPVVERRQGQAIHRCLRREGHEDRLAGFCAGAGTHRHLRQRRHALVRAAGARSIILRARPREGACAAASRVEGQGTVCLAAQGRFEYRARRRRPCDPGTHHGYAHGHDHGGI